MSGKPWMQKLVVIHKIWICFQKIINAEKLRTISFCIENFCIMDTQSSSFLGEGAASYTLEAGRIAALPRMANA